VVHNTALNSSDNLHSYTPDNHLADRQTDRQTNSIMPTADQSSSIPYNQLKNRTLCIKHACKTSCKSVSSE